MGVKLNPARLEEIAQAFLLPSRPNISRHLSVDHVLLGIIPKMNLM
jgi:hypothetical protein